MDTSATDRRRLPLPLLFAGGVALTMILTLAIFFAFMRPALEELGAMAAFLSITAVISVGAGHLVYRTGLLERSPRLSLSILGGYALSGLLIFVNVWITAVLMFVSEHDLWLATILLLFADGIAMSFGFFFAASLNDRIAKLTDAAEQVAQGHLETRVSQGGRDEVAELAHAFNDMAKQLEQAEQQKRRADRLRRDLVAWVGHDLRTPLTSVRVIVEALADEMVQDRETVQRYLQTAQHQLGSLSALLDDLFAMAQIDAGGLQLERHPSSLCDLISDTMEAFSAVAVRQGVKLEGSAPPEVDPVFMDVEKIGRVLNNLLENALRHTPKGGEVHLNTSVEAKCVTVEVRDTGEGIADEDLSHVFERFYRGEKSRSRATGGAGLGLAIAAGIVEAHNGQIGLESAIGRGTRVWFTLPRQ